MSIKSFFSRLILSLNKVNRLLITSISIGVAIVILGFLVYQQRSILLNYHWQFRPLPIIFAFIVFSIALFWVAILWGWIVNKLGIKLDYWKHIRYYMISNVAKRIPGTVWYVASRYQLYSSEGFDLKITAVASAIEMVIITLAGILVALVSSTQTIMEYHISPAVLIILFILGLLLLHPKIIQWIMSRRKVELSRITYKFVITGIIYYSIVWISGGIFLFYIVNAIYPISYDNLIYMISCWSLVGIISTLFFFSPSNLGVTEIGLSLLLSKIVPSSIAVIIAISSRILSILFEILWALVFMWLKKPEKSLLTQKD